MSNRRDFLRTSTFSFLSLPFFQFGLNENEKKDDFEGKVCFEVECKKFDISDDLNSFSSSTVNIDPRIVQSLLEYIEFGCVGVYYKPKKKRIDIGVVNKAIYCPDIEKMKLFFVIYKDFYFNELGFSGKTNFIIDGIEKKLYKIEIIDKNYFNTHNYDVILKQ